MKSISVLVLVGLWPWLAEGLAAEAAKGEERAVLTLRRPDLARYQPSPALRIFGAGDYVIERRLFQPSAGEYAISIDNHFKGR